MRRSIGKGIRMDEPPPPEYGIIPMSPNDDTIVISDDEIAEPSTSYSLPQSSPSDPSSSRTHGQLDNHEESQIVSNFMKSMTLEMDDGPEMTLPIRKETSVHSFDSPMTPTALCRTVTSYILNSEISLQPPLTPVKKKKKPKKRGKKGHGSHKKTEVENSEVHYTENVCLFDIIQNACMSLQTIVDEWIETYKANREKALQALTQFFINASGCKGKITQNMVSDMEHADIIRKMTEEFDEESGEYPLIMSGQRWKKFGINYCDFIVQLVKQCQYSIIYDQYLMDNIISFLTGLSDSQVRAFRHTSTLAAMKMMTALVDVLLVVSVNLDNAQRQYESERQKPNNKRATDRLEHLLNKRHEFEENLGELKNMLTYIFKAVFVHRYRDTVPEIRAVCISEIGIWMKKYHQNFLDDSHLKYIGWTLHDKVGEVRLKCLQALQILYTSEELKEKLELFSSKFKDRIVVMILDEDYDVAVEAVKLITNIFKYHQGVLTDKDCEHVYELVYSSYKPLAQVAGEFLNECLFAPVETITDQRTKRGKKRLPNTPLIRDLIQFFIESELHEHGAYLVDSLIESNKMMKDWECMTDLLLEEPGPNEEPLEDKQESSLIEIMVCCVKQASTGDAPVGRGSTRKIPLVKETKKSQDDKEILTQHFISVLPKLLDKYSADPEKLKNLLTVPLYFDLEIYTRSRQEADLVLLLKAIKNIIGKHDDVEVIECCAKILEVLCTEGIAIYSRCDVQRHMLIDSIVNQYKEAMDDWNMLIAGEETPDDDETYNVVNSLKKVSIFYSSHNLNKWDLYDSLYKNVDGAKNGITSLPAEAVKYCITACHFSLLWHLYEIEEMFGSGGPAGGEILKLNSRLRAFMDSMKKMLIQSHNQIYKEEAYLVVCDLQIVFSNELHTHFRQEMGCLVYESDESFQTALNEFLQGSVFSYKHDFQLDDHSIIEGLHKRRNFLASYCKLIVCGLLPSLCAVNVFKHYVKSYNDYGDIIKATIGKVKEINKLSCARTTIVTLISLFIELKDMRGNRFCKSLDDFATIKELAKRFALIFGLDLIKNREAITIIHRSGILFAVNSEDNIPNPTGVPRNLPFLEILSEFTIKLLNQDKKIVLNYLDKHIPTNIPITMLENWKPLHIYRSGLLSGEANQSPIPSKRAYFRKSKETVDAELLVENVVGLSELELAGIN